jgi:hypothetical protein
MYSIVGRGGAPALPPNRGEFSNQPSIFRRIQTVVKYALHGAYSQISPSYSKKFFEKNITQIHASKNDFRSRSSPYGLFLRYFKGAAEITRDQKKRPQQEEA